MVGIGASAGGLAALEQFFAASSAVTGGAYVVVTHLDPDHKTLLPELLQRTTAMAVRQVDAAGVRLAADTVHVIPPDRDLVLEGDVLRVRASSRTRGAARRIDVLFRSLAHERGAGAIGVVLSGMGDDGAEGLRAIAEAGGAALIQDPVGAEFDAMPRAAIAKVPTASVVAADRMPARIAALTGGPPLAVSPAAPGAALARVLELLRLRTGRDLSQYKASSIERRLERRLAVHRLATLDDYAGYLEANPEEAELLLRELLIGVTQFFRDDEAFVVLRDQALPAVVARKRPPRVLRAWVAGCSSGEEAYSLAIIVSEVLAQAGAADVHVQIYATDLDGDAIAHARAGRYAHDIAAQVSPDRLARHFTRDDRGYAVRAELRDRVVFAKHDLISDPPFTRLDVVCCRNVLIYLQPALQHKLVSQFHYALGPGGLLVLGASEAIPATAAALFGAFDGKAKVFRRLDVAPTRAAPLGLAAAPQAPGAGAVHHDAAVPSVVEAARHAIVETVAPPTVLINGRGDVLYASRRTGRYLEPAVGKANINIFAMAREGLAAHLSLGVRQATARRRRVTLAGVEVRGERARYLVDLVVVPLEEPAVLRGSLLVVFDEPPPVAKPRARARRAGSASLERELVRLKQHLQAVAREMEASQLEAEAANEALQCANEELQSTNEEVTTSKEELQAMNEELMTLNAELEAKNSELATANDDLRNLLNSTKLPTLFLDNALRLKRFTSEVTRIANVQPGDVGRVITDLTLKLDYRELARDVAEVLETLIAKEVAVTSDDGTTYLMRIHPYRTTQNALDGVVVTFFDLGALRRAEAIIAAGPRVVP